MLERSDVCLKPVLHQAALPAVARCTWQSASRSGEWKPGTAIPNESDLAREFGVSAGTMRKALDLMEAEHLLTRRQGRGTFVNDQSSDELAMRFNNMRSPDGKRVCGQVKTVGDHRGRRQRAGARRACGCRPTTASIASTACGMHNGQVFLIEDAIAAGRAVPGLDREEERVADRIIVLAQQYGLLLGKAEERISLGEAIAGGGANARDRRRLAGDGAGSRGAGARRPPGRVADRLLPPHRQVLLGRHGLSRRPVAASGAPPTGPLQSGAELEQHASP